MGTRLWFESLVRFLIFFPPNYFPRFFFAKTRVELLLLCPKNYYCMERISSANKSKSAGRALSCCFTLNNYTAEELTAIRGDTVHYKWLCYGEEVGESGTPHLQGAFSVVGSSQVAYSTMHTYAGMARAHFIKSMGTCQQNIDYCFKGDLSHDDYMTGGKRQHPNWGHNAVTFFSGTPPEPGKSHKLREAANLIRSGSKVEDLARMEEHAGTVVQYTRGLLYLESCNVPARVGAPKIFWLHGPTGVGKTRCAIEFGESDGSYWKSGGNSSMGSGLRWFDGYNGQRVAILDDFRATGVRFDFILQLLDRYTFKVEFKGGSVPWVPSVIFITTPKSIKKTFATRFLHKPEDLAQLYRRVTTSLRFGKKLGDYNYKNALAFVRLQCAGQAVDSDLEDSDPSVEEADPTDSEYYHSVPVDDEILIGDEAGDDYLLVD